MKRTLNFRVVEGDPNEIDKNEILITRDNSTGEITNIQKRDSTGELKSIVVPKKNEEVLYIRDTTLDELCVNILNIETKQIEKVEHVSFNSTTGYYGVILPREDIGKPFIVTIGKVFEEGHTLQIEDYELICVSLADAEKVIITFTTPPNEGGRKLVSLGVLMYKNSILNFKENMFGARIYFYYNQ